jgi:hypothetical protein
MEPMLAQALPQEAVKCFRSYSNLLNTSISRDPEADIASIEADLEKGLAQLWFVMNPDVIAAFITHIEVGEWGDRVAFVRYLSGKDLSQIMRRLPELEIWATHQNCWAIDADVRPGLVRQLAKFGFEYCHKLDDKRTRIRKDID